MGDLLLEPSSLHLKVCFAVLSSSSLGLFLLVLKSFLLLIPVREA